jgi:sortase A
MENKPNFVVQSYPIAVSFLAIFFAVTALWLLVGHQLRYLYNRAQRPLPAVNQAHQYTLFIPKLKVTAPIIVDVPGDDETYYLQAVERGVAQLKGSAKPGEIGNSFIFGHSSFFFVGPGQYKTVFQKLRLLRPGDELTIKRDNQVLTYQVIEGRIVEPNDFAVLASSQKEQITLMACWPPGTLAKRYIVVAERLKNKVGLK